MATSLFRKKHFKNLFSPSLVFIFFFIIFAFFAVVFSFNIAPAQAADSELELDYPEILGQKPETIATSLPSYIKYIYDFAIAFAGLITLGSLIWGGFIYFTSTGDPMKIKTAKEQMTAAFTGLLILLSSYLILATINPNLLSLPDLSLIVYEPLAPAAQLPQNPGLKTSAVSESLPLSKSMNADENGVFGKEATDKLKLTVDELEELMTAEDEIEDSELASNGPAGFFGLGKFLKIFGVVAEDENPGGNSFDRISDLMKYLKTLTDRCFCNNMTALCAKPEAGGQPVGCSGDPCQTDQGNGVEADSARGKINKVLEITQEKIKQLIEQQKKINSQKIILRDNLRNFQEVEEGISACQNQGADISPLSQYLETKKISEKYGDKFVEIPNSRVSGQGDPLTFYCAKGGNVFDYLHIPESEKETEELEARLEQAEQYEPGQGIKEAERLACPIKISAGGTLDKLREIAVANIIKFERASNLISQILKEIKEMTELVSQCNSKQCKPSCACVPNPCYMCCAPPGCSFCIPICRAKCLQVVGTCQGEACPREAIAAKSEEIKNTEDKIFETIKQLEKTFPKISSLLSGAENPDNLASVSDAVRLCYNPNVNDLETASWNLTTCASAKGSYNSSGQLIEDCNPRDFYCCVMTNQDIADLRLPLPADQSPVYIAPSNEFAPLSTINGCPKGWLCADEVKRQYDERGQYDDASEPLKQLLSCARTKLDAIQKAEGLKATEILGNISYISDPKIYQGTCDWTRGPLIDKGCSHTYNIKRGLERISAHYGGKLCRWNHLSYAVDLDFTEDIQKQYAEEIIMAVKECSPGAHILDEVSRVHIGIAESSDCNASDY